MSGSVGLIKKDLLTGNIESTLPADLSCVVLPGVCSLLTTHYSADPYNAGLAHKNEPETCVIFWNMGAEEETFNSIRAKL